MRSVLSTAAWNAFLKTLEEPPPNTVFVLATTEVHKVPATIRSRCQQYNFRLISTAEIKEKLREAAGELLWLGAAFPTALGAQTARIRPPRPYDGCSARGTRP